MTRRVFHLMSRLDLLAGTKEPKSVLVLFLLMLYNKKL